MTAPQGERVGWTIQEAERLLLSLKGVVAARVVARPGGEVEEIHLLTTDEVKPKQTVRNVESALLSQLDLQVDHRKISVAQTDIRTRPVAEPDPVVPVHIAPAPDPALSAGRLLFYGHQVETERANRLKHRVEIEWQDELYQGEAVAADVTRARVEAVAQATLNALEAAARATLDERRRGITLELEGARSVDAFDRSFILVAVHALAGRQITSLAGAAMVQDSPERAAIMATLQATDRWVRGHFQ